MEISFGGRRIEVEKKVQKLKNEIPFPAEEDGYELIYAHASGGKVWRHELVDVMGIDYDDVLEVAIDKAQLGCEVHILPVLAEDHPLRKTVFANAKPRKCPDLKIDGRYTEIKIPIGTLQQQKISRNIKVGHAQADEVILKLNATLKLRALHEIAKGRFLTHRHLAVIEFKMEGVYHHFERSDFI